MAVPVVAAVGTPVVGDDSVTTITVDMPSGIQAGNVLYILASHDSSSGAAIYNTPTGWTEEDFIQGGPGSLWLFSRRADGTEGASVELTMSSLRYKNAVAFRVTGVDPGVSDLTNQYAEEVDTGTGVSRTSPSITTTLNDCLILSAWITDNVVTDSIAPAGAEIEIADFQNPDFNTMVLAAYRTAAAAPGTFDHDVTLEAAGSATLSIIWAINAVSPAGAQELFGGGRIRTGRGLSW